MFNRSNRWQKFLLFQAVFVFLMVASVFSAYAQVSDAGSVSSQPPSQTQADEIDVLIQKSQNNIEEMQKVVGHVDEFQKKIQQLQSQLQTLAKKQAMYRQQLEKSRQMNTAMPGGTGDSLLSRDQIAQVAPAGQETHRTGLSSMSFERMVIIVILVILIIVIGLLLKLTMGMRRAPIPRPVGVMAQGGSEQLTVVPESRESQYDPVIRKPTEVDEKTVMINKAEELEALESEAEEPVIEEPEVEFQQEPVQSEAPDLHEMDFELDDTDIGPTTDDDLTPFPPLDALPDKTGQETASSDNEQLVKEITDKFKALVEDPIASKIALANIYLQMKDLEGAKAQLIDVFREGDVESQEKAVKLVERIQAESDHLESLTISQSLHIVDSAQPLHEQDRVTDVSDHFRMLSDDEISKLFALAHFQYESGDFKQARENISRLLGQSGDKYKSEAIDLLFRVEADELEQDKEAEKTDSESAPAQEEEEGASPWEFTSVRPVGTGNHRQEIPESDETKEQETGEPMKLDLGLDEDVEEQDEDDTIVPDFKSSEDAVEETESGQALSVFDLQFESNDDKANETAEIERDESDVDAGPAETVEEVKSSVIDQNVVREISDRFRALSENEHGAKLALAYVYRDMNETELAKELLTEVIAFGEEQYKEEAQNLLNKIESGEKG